MKEFKNEVGNRYGKLSVIEYAYTKERLGAFFLCKCDCGRLTTVRGNNLRNGRTVSCGCIKRETNGGKNRLDPNEYIGFKNNMLTITKILDYNKEWHSWNVECECECGNTTRTTINHVKTGHTKSCGCRHQKYANSDSQTKLYDVWIHMNGRCYNPKSSSYKWYGGKGIGVCDEWRRKNDKTDTSSFIAFKNWALENGYIENPTNSRSLGLDIDRIDPAKDYCPENCRFIPHNDNVRLATSKNKHDNQKGSSEFKSSEHTQSIGIEPTNVE